MPHTSTFCKIISGNYSLPESTKLITWSICHHSPLFTPTFNIYNTTQVRKNCFYHPNPCSFLLCLFLFFFLQQNLLQPSVQFISIIMSAQIYKNISTYSSYNFISYSIRAPECSKWDYSCTRHCDYHSKLKATL